MRQDLELLLSDQLNPYDEGHVQHTAILATYLAATGTNLDMPPTGEAKTTQQPSCRERTKDLRGRRRSNPDKHKVSERRGKLPRPASTEWGPETTTSGNAVDVEGLLHQQSDRRILATSSRADQGTETAVGDAEDRIDFEGFRARVGGAQQARAQGLEGRLSSDATPAAADGVNQVESRTPPAMERNLFLSALANGKLEVMKTERVKLVWSRCCPDSHRRARAM